MHADPSAVLPALPRVHYGGVVPAPSEICLGGLVKCQRLQPFFPDAGARFDVLYLVSSGLPDGWLPTYFRARRDRRRVVWNQSAVSYRAVWPDLACDEDNLMLEQGLHSADYVIYQSAFSRAVADRYLGPFAGPSEVLYNAVDTQAFTPPPRAPRRDGPAILLAGTQYRLSSLEIALAAVAALRRRMPAAHLVVTGSMCWTPDRSAALHTARTRVAALGLSDAVRFLGEYTQAEAPEVYGLADVLIHTRYDDLCPNVVLEAMACGVPVVYGRTGGTPELVGDAAGIAVDIGHSWDEERFAEPERWAAALEQVAADRARFAGAARSRATDRFDLRPWIERHAAVFERVTSAPPREATARMPVNERLRRPLQLLEVLPARVRARERFNVQPDGRSAATVRAGNATHATMIAVDGEPQETSYSDARRLSMIVPAHVTSTPGTRHVRLVELLRASNALEFFIEPSSRPEAAPRS